MRVAFYVRVSTERQQQAQTIEQQVSRLHAYLAEQAGWSVAEEHIFRDDGRSGAQLNRPGLDALRDQAAHAAFDLVLMTAPDRLARNYVHQMIVLEELERWGCRVHFIDRPLRTDDPHEQLVLQIRGAVAEYERTLIADRMRRGRLAKLQSGQLLPWTHRLYGYRLDPERPRDPAGLQLEPAESAIVQEIFDRYAPGGVSLYALARRLTERQVPSPMGRAHWNPSTVRGILTNPAYMGLAASGKTRAVRAERRWSALKPVGRGESTRPRPVEEWIQIPVPAIVSAEQFARVQEVLIVNQQRARRNVKHEYLLRGLVSCGSCQLACRGSARDPQEVRYRYYVCRGKQHAVMSSRDEPCTARFIPALQLDELVWADLCHLLQDPQIVAAALERARSGAWLPEELRRRQASLRQVWEAVGRQRQRLLDAYLAGVVELAGFQAKDGELRQRQADLQTQEQEIAVSSRRLQELQELTRSAAAVGERLRVGLETATAAQRRQLVELLIDRVVVTDGEVEIRYVIPLTEASTQSRFCQLRTDYLRLAAIDIPVVERQGLVGAAGDDKAGIRSFGEHLCLEPHPAWCAPTLRLVGRLPGQAHLRRAALDLLALGVGQ